METRSVSSVVDFLFNSFINARKEKGPIKLSFNICNLFHSKLFI